MYQYIVCGDDKAVNTHLHTVYGGGYIFCVKISDITLMLKQAGSSDVLVCVQFFL